MKTTKGIAINFLGDGGVSMRAEWYNNKENVHISGKDYTPELLYIVVENFRKIRTGQSVSNLYR